MVRLYAKDLIDLIEATVSKAKVDQAVLPSAIAISNKSGTQGQKPSHIKFSNFSESATTQAPSRIIKEIIPFSNDITVRPKNLKFKAVVISTTKSKFLCLNNDEERGNFRPLLPFEIAFIEEVRSVEKKDVIETPSVNPPVFNAPTVISTRVHVESVSIECEVIELSDEVDKECPSSEKRKADVDNIDLLPNPMRKRPTKKKGNKKEAPGDFVPFDYKLAQEEKNPVSSPVPPKEKDFSPHGFAADSHKKGKAPRNRRKSGNKSMSFK
jgi:hypothetical protein